MGPFSCPHFSIWSQHPVWYSINTYFLRGFSGGAAAAKSLQSCPTLCDPRQQPTLVIQNPPANAETLRDLGLISWSGRPPGEGNSNPLQYSCLGQSIKGTEVPGGLVHRVTRRHSWSDLAHRSLLRYPPCAIIRQTRDNSKQNMASIYLRAYNLGI